MSGFLIAMITALHIAVCVALMTAILLQSGKGGGLAGTFGAGSSQTLFGGRGAASFLSRATTTLAVIFFLTSLTLGLQASRSSGRRSLVQEEARRRGQQRTATEGTTAPGSPSAPVQGSRSGSPGAGPGGTSFPSAGPMNMPGNAPGPAAPSNSSPTPGGASRAPASTPPASAPAGGGTQAPAPQGK